MEQATQAPTPTAPGDRALYELAQDVSRRLVAQTTVMPSSVRVGRELSDRYDVHIYFGAGLEAGRGVLHVAATTDTDVTRDDQLDGEGHVSSVWLEARTIVRGVAVYAYGLTHPSEADELLQQTPTDDTAAESDTEVTQPLPTVGTGPADVVIPAVIPVTPLPAPSSADSGDGCPRNVIDGDVGGHLYKHGAFVDGPMRCMYCGGAKPEDGGTPKVAPLSAKAQEPEAGE
ncbi:hypothetical protein [Streptomyces sp. CL7]|uniref:hypothetical protein n=1 Tax=Streptomyces sp. CL7 TaxID=3096006 RepID=UPI002A753628|nr:hypothetical protein [Streptomyces sp. CL7]WPP29991.1 hypothetical protein SJH97_11895 [Streptomyces sp. CL7]